MHRLRRNAIRKKSRRIRYLSCSTPLPGFAVLSVQTASPLPVSPSLQQSVANVCSDSQLVVS